MDRATKLTVVVWTGLALALNALFASRAWSELLPLTLGVAAVAALLAAVDRRAVPFVLAFAYIFPALISQFHRAYVAEYEVLWMAALFGAIAPDSSRTEWRVPAVWRPALAYWALVVSASATVVLWRELNFNFEIMAPMPYADLTGGPGSHGSWVLHVATMMTLGILWFDWLFGLTEATFSRSVIAPLAVSAILTGLAALYQLFVDVTVLNRTPYGALGRAAGMVNDANVVGSIAAMWIGGSVLAAGRLGSWRRPALVAGVLLGWVTAWGSGSRSALIAAFVVSIFNLVALWQAERGTSQRRTAALVLGAAVAMVALVVALASAHFLRVSALNRIALTLPAPTVESVRAFVLEQLWRRNGYGSAAVEIIRQFPLVGIGIGCFHFLAYMFFSGWALPPDNAQNWFRHQFAELGVVGSVGWIVWTVAFAGFAWRRRARSPQAWVGFGMLCAFALTSIFGMPSQHIAATVTFWTAVYWFVSIVGRPSGPQSVGRAPWLLVVILTAVYTLGVVRVGATRLSLNERIVRMTPHSNGFYPPEPDQAGGQFRWAKREAAVVLETPTRWLALNVGVNHLDIASKPVDVHVWCDGTLVIKTRLQSLARTSRYVQLPEGKKRVLIETLVSRAVFPRDLGLPDPREFGLMVNWRFVDGPEPRGDVVRVR